MNEQTSQEFEHLLDYLKATRGFDFRAYKRSTLQRRVDRRLSVVGIESYEDYRLYLESEPEEFAQLFNTFLINVTAFFRDAAPWTYMSEHRAENGREQAEVRPDTSMERWLCHRRGSLHSGNDSRRS